MRELALRIGAEALEAGQQRGHAVVPIFGLTAEDVRGSNRLLETLLDRINPGCRSARTRLRAAGPDQRPL